MSTHRNPVPAKWDATQMASQRGKIAIVTGANSGIGFFTALELARHGAHVIVACRSEQRGLDAVQKIQQELQLSEETTGSVEYQHLDVSSLTSVKTFAEDFTKRHARLDLLVNNAGIFAVPFALTVDGIESQFATNHLGHFALTAHLMGVLKQSDGVARVVNVSSNGHKRAKMDISQITSTNVKNYSEVGVYNNTKLYNLLFSLELNRRLRADGITNVIATTAHPGLATTNVLDAASSWLLRLVYKVLWMLPIVQTSEFGALPSLYAAVGENVQPDDYIGPDGFQAFSGYPAKEQPVNVARSPAHAQALWVESEKLAQLTFTI